MNNKFIPLDCEDDVVLIEKDTFKVSRLKELLYIQTTKKLAQNIYDYQTKSPGTTIIGSFFKIDIGTEPFQLDEIQYHFFKACQILQVGSKGWQKGNLKIKMNNSTTNQQDLVVQLEFYPDILDEPESPLDEIRQMALTQT